MSFLPAGFPAPERDVIEALRRGILAELKTPHPPHTDELAVLIAADEAGIDVSGVDPVAVWQASPDERAVVFAALGRLLGEVAS